MFKVVLATIIMFFHQPRAVAEASGFQSWAQVCEQAEAVVAEGDLVFLDIPVGLFRRVAAATGSWTSHVGIVFRDSRGHWVVDEGAIPLSTERPLCDFLKKSTKYRFEIRRLNRSLNAQEIAQMKVVANSHMGEIYDLGFNFDSNRMFCSKFVYLIYQSISVDVGRLQTFRELFEENPKASLLFWKLWYFGRIPFDRRTVTPASQLQDLKFTTVMRGD